MVSTSVIVPLLVGVNLYQIVFEVPVTNGIRGSCEQAGTGSVVWAVAPELSLLSVKEPLVRVMLTAFAKLSLAGAGATTTNVGNITVDVSTVVPPPGGGFCTPTEFVLPKLAIKGAGTVAVSWVALTNVVAIGVPPMSGFINTLELALNPVPFTVMVVAAELTGAVAGLTGELMVGGPPRTVNARELLAVATITLTCATLAPANRFVGTVALIWLSLTTVVLSGVVVVPTVHCAVPPVSPFPFTVSVNGVAAPAEAETGEIEEICGPAKVKLLSPICHVPRPCVAAISVREAW